MSGIVGIMNLDGGPMDGELLRRMTQCLAPRGPDAQETWVHGNVGFGHAMLRTSWEATEERQPCTLDGTTWIIADCRVDARADLIRELAAHDLAPAKDAPDPVLILSAYAAWDTACVEHLLGDFAFAIWDGRSRSLFCARDQFGVKPFFYTHAGEALIFSNALNCVRLHPAVSDELDDFAIADYLVYTHPLDPDRSSFAAIRRLAPAHTLTVTRAGPVTRRYWQFTQGEEIRYKRRGAYIEHFRELLDSAVRDRLRTSTVGVFMSGGLDSPTIAATAHRLLSASASAFDLRAHSFVFDRIVADEERWYSQLAADAIGIPIHHIPLDDYRFPPERPDPEGYPPEPKSPLDHGRAIQIHRGPAAASRVLLRGDGLDALLYTTASTLESRLGEGCDIRLLRDLLWLVQARGAVPHIGFRTLLRKALGHTTPLQVQPFPDWFQPELERRLDLRGRWHAVNSATLAKPGLELADAYWPHQFEYYDPGSMGLAAEVRYPYVDLRLARYLVALPAIPWYVEKSLMRAAMKGVLPRQLLRRPKAPVAGNPWAFMLPAAATRWWEEHLVPAPDLERYVDVPRAQASLAQVAHRTQANNLHEDIDILRSSLAPIGLNLWLRSRVDGKLCAADAGHAEICR